MSYGDSESSDSRGEAAGWGEVAIRTEGLTKYFGRFPAVTDLDLDVRTGDVYGFLGANGSGKTTTVRMLLGLVLATSGRIEVLGQPMPRAAGTVLREVGAMIEGPAAYPQLSGRANLALLDAAGRTRRRGRAGRVDDALERVGLGGVDRRPVRAYSLGMKQRLGLAAAVFERPRLLVLDEPTNGLDPQGIRDIRGLLVELNGAGTTVFVSSHLLAEMEQLCTRVGVLDRGRLVLQEHLADLRRPTGRVLLRTSRPDEARAVLAGHRVETGLDGLLVVGESGVARVGHEGGTHGRGAVDPAALATELVRGGVPILELVPERRTLEEVVLERTTGGADTFARPTGSSPVEAASGPEEVAS